MVRTVRYVFIVVQFTLIDSIHPLSAQQVTSMQVSGRPSICKIR